jgi:hypothetical protein
MKKNTGYRWSLALLVCSILYLVIYTVVAVRNHYTNGLILPILRYLTAQSAGFACAQLALAVAGMNTRKWKSKNTQALFILGLIASALYVLAGVFRLRLLIISDARAVLFALFRIATLACLIGYSFAFRMKKELPSEGRL